MKQKVGLPSDADRTFVCFSGVAAEKPSMFAIPQQSESLLALPLPADASSSLG
jgi:hypothetical protein